MEFNLNGASSSWKPIKSGVPQVSVFDPLLFLVFINDLPDHLICNPKLFADDVSLNAIMYDEKYSTENIEHDLKLIQDWSVKWKMLFNPDITKPAEEVLFTNRNASTHFPIAFDGISIKPVSEYKHLGLILDSKLTFNKHIDEKYILRTGDWSHSMIQIYKSFIRPHLDYCDIIIINICIISSLQNIILNELLQIPYIITSNLPRKSKLCSTTQH